MLGPAEEMARAFQTAHGARFGFADPGRDLIVEALTVEGTGVTEKNRYTNPRSGGFRFEGKAKRSKVNSAIK